MCQPRKWWWGLLPLLLLLALANQFRMNPVETDLAARSSAALKAAGFPWATAALEGRDVVLKGEAMSPDQQAKAVSVVDSTEGVRLVSNSSTVLAEAKPYTFSATREGNKITLSGYVPNQEARLAAIDAAKKSFPGAEVVDQLKLARGVGPLFAAGSAFGLGQLGKLASGKLDLSDATMSLVGKAGDLPSFNGVTGALKALPTGLLAGKFDITPPAISPYTWSAERDGNVVTLSGYAPTEAAKAAIAAAAKVAMPNAEIRNNLVVAPAGAAAGFEPTTAYALAQLGRLEKGKASLSDLNLSVVGNASTFDIRKSVEDALGKVANGAKLALVDIKSPAQVVAAPPPPPVPPPAPVVVPAPPVPVVVPMPPAAAVVIPAPTPAPAVVVPAPAPAKPAPAAPQVTVLNAACGDLVRDAIKQGTVHFAYNRAELLSDSKPVLDALVGVHKKCANMKMEVIGHTDADGSPEYNLDLSIRRAKAVVEALANLGFSKNALAFSGAGEMRPLVPNTSAANKAQNRRVELVVK